MCSGSLMRMQKAGADVSCDTDRQRRQSEDIR